MAEKAPPMDHVDGHQTRPHTYYPVAIIGAGESGIAMGCQLRRQLGFDQFRIFERMSGIGGTWFASRYPGIACDVPAVCYSYSWAQNFGWTALHPSGSEILAYLNDVARRFHIHDKVQTHTNVASVRWLDDAEEWELVLEHLLPEAANLSVKDRQALVDSHGLSRVCSRAETVRAKVVISAVGGLIEPKAYPAIPGMDEFEGQICHTGRWDDTVRLEDKDVVVLGSGCSAAQVVPEIIQPPYNAKSVTQLLRSPGWVHPSLPPAAEAWWEKHTPQLFSWVPGLQRLVRKLLFASLELDFKQHFGPGPNAQKARAQKQKSMIQYMQSTVPEKYWDILTPDYEFGCKRRIIDTGWFRSLQDPKVEITSQPLTWMQAHSVTLGPGRHYPPLSQTDSQAATSERVIPCDVLLFASGYDTGEWLHPIDVRGRQGRSLHEVWKQRGGAQAYQGTAMDGFPNFFLLFGPNTGTGHSSVILASENMVNYCLKLIQPILTGHVRTCEVREAAERRWTADIQRALQDSVWTTGGCTSWYFKQVDRGSDETNTPVKWNATMYPWSQVHFSLRCMFPYWRDWDLVYTRKGLSRKRFRSCLFALILLLATAAIATHGISTTFSAMCFLAPSGTAARE